MGSSRFLFSFSTDQPWSALQACDFVKKLLHTTKWVLLEKPPSTIYKIKAPDNRSCLLPKPTNWYFAEWTQQAYSFALQVSAATRQSETRGVKKIFKNNWKITGKCKNSIWVTFKIIKKYINLLKWNVQLVQPIMSYIGVFETMVW